MTQKSFSGLNGEKPIGYFSDPWELQISPVAHIAKCANSVVRLRKKARLWIFIGFVMNKAWLFLKINEKNWKLAWSPRRLLFPI